MVNNASCKLQCSLTTGKSCVCMMSCTRVKSRRPKAPAGCDKAKSALVKLRACNSATAKASPKANVAVVLEVGASPSGQASSDFPSVKAISADFGKNPRLSRLMLIKGILSCLTTGISVRISSDSPEFEIAIKTSPATSIPKSPCPASPGCIKKAGVPVDANVAATLRPICPDFPIPVTTTRL